MAPAHRTYSRSPRVINLVAKRKKKRKKERRRRKRRIREEGKNYRAPLRLLPTFSRSRRKKGRSIALKTNVSLGTMRACTHSRAQQCDEDDQTNGRWCENRRSEQDERWHLSLPPAVTVITCLLLFR